MTKRVMDCAGLSARALMSTRSPDAEAELLLCAR